MSATYKIALVAALFVAVLVIGWALAPSGDDEAPADLAGNTPAATSDTTSITPDNPMPAPPPPGSIIDEAPDADASDTPLLARVDAADSPQPNTRSDNLTPLRDDFDPGSATLGDDTELDSTDRSSDTSDLGQGADRDPAASDDAALPPRRPIGIGRFRPTDTTTQDTPTRETPRRIGQTQTDQPVTPTRNPTRSNPQPSPTTHTVETGDTLSGISLEVYGSAKYWRTIAQANPDVDPRKLKLGQEIKLPPRDQVVGETSQAASETTTPAGPSGPGERHTVEATETLSDISEQYYGTQNRWRAIYDANREVIGDNPDRVPAGVVLRIPPASSP